ncbi:hypothetical protein DB42_AQ00640 [Neochlamydia sp. EPS4]|nr:hypothetical protein DB42_AQ00640 [Neochlamydia sp. EPS4]
MERGNLIDDVKRKPYSEEHKVGNIEACMRGRSTRSSEEVFVMKRERRG